MSKRYCWICGHLFHLSNLYEYRDGVYLCRECFLGTGGGEPPRTPAEPIKQQTNRGKP